MTTATEVAVRESYAPAQQAGALAIRADQTAWDKMQLAALGQLGLKGAPEGDLMVFLHVSQRMGLDPFTRQVYMIKRRESAGKDDRGKTVYTDKWTIQTGIDGFRVNRARAERAAGVRGILGRPVFYDREGKTYPAWFRADTPAACEITYTLIEWDQHVSAYRETPYTSILRFDEYAQSGKNDNGTRYLTGQWATKGSHMLEKCTEADVYRKAFPQDFSGVQLDDAMPVADAAPEPEHQAPPVTDLRQRAAAQTVKAEVVEPRPTGAADAAASEPTPAPVSAETAPPASPAPSSRAYAQDLEVIAGKTADLGLDADGALRVAGKVAGYPVKALNALKPADAARVAATLEGLADGAALAALLDDIAMAGQAVPGGE